MRRLLDPAVLAGFFAAVAGGVLVLAYVVIAFKTGSASPWNLVVHEDGQRTLLNTVFYFEHAARELPLDLLLGIAIGASVAVGYPSHEAAKRSGHGWVAALALGVLVVVGVILAGAAIQVGLPAMLDNLLQQHTRPGAPLVWGAHWRYHVGSRLALILMSIGLAGALRLAIDRGRARGGGSGLVVFGGTLALFAALTILMAESWLALRLVFQEPVALGHQARELLTHVLVTIPIGWAACLLVVRPSATDAPGRSGQANGGGAMVAALIMGVIGALLAAYVGIAALLADAASHGQTSDLAMLVFPHVFEHSLGYLLVPAVAVLVYGTLRSPG